MSSLRDLRVCLLKGKFLDVKNLRCAATLVMCAVTLSSVPLVATAQQPGTPSYNSVFLPGHGVGDTRQRGRDNWGSVASSRNLSAIHVTGMRSKKQAERTVLGICEEQGGERCKIHRSFVNICIAVAENPSKMSSRTSHPRETSADFRREEAIRLCGSDCKISWEGCALD